MAKPKVTEREVRLARAFLSGVHGNQANTYLILAIVAWMRAASRAHDPFFKSLARYSARSAGLRLAAKLLYRAKHDPKDYRGLLKALRRQTASDAGLSGQAADFLRGIEDSPWDKKHYGYVKAADGHYEHVWHTVPGYPGEGYWTDTWVPAVQEQDPLWNAYAKLTNNPNIPQKWFTDTTTTTTTTHHRVPPRPSQPRSFSHGRPAVDYILPYAAVDFYDERPHLGSQVLVDG